MLFQQFGIYAILVDPTVQRETEVESEGRSISPTFANEWCHDHDNATCHSQRASNGFIEELMLP